ncbi:hypothetical protein TWF506_004625 [Arthrobotrys conoides]|uniref:BTB domain-containing protein n=1 Tax=Arthrobotrys conoides TaxID=74498 RepID=A0AAN8RI24_9PEZI
MSRRCECIECSIFMRAINSVFQTHEACPQEESDIGILINDRLATVPNDRSEPIIIYVGRREDGTYRQKYVLRMKTCTKNSEYFKCALRFRSNPNLMWREARNGVFHFSTLPYFNVIAKALVSGRVNVEPTNFLELYETADYLQMEDVMFLVCALLSRPQFLRKIHDLNKCLTRLVKWLEKWQHRTLVQVGFFRAIFYIEFTAAVKRRKAARGCRLLGGWEDAPRQWGLNPLDSELPIRWSGSKVPPGAIPERYHRLKALRDFVKEELKDTEDWSIEDVRCEDCGGGGVR